MGRAMYRFHQYTDPENGVGESLTVIVDATSDGPGGLESSAELATASFSEHTGDSAPVWTHCLEEAKAVDDNLRELWNADLDSFLIFVSSSARCVLSHYNLKFNDHITRLHYSPVCFPLEAIFSAKIDPIN